MNADFGHIVGKIVHGPESDSPDGVIVAAALEDDDIHVWVSYTGGEEKGVVERYLLTEVVFNQPWLLESR